MLHYDVLIVGAGHGGAQAALSLRQQGFAGTIAIVGDEPEIPYERPPLSKDYLTGEKDFERILIRPPNFWIERDIPIWTGKRVVAVDPAAKVVTIAGGETMAYERLIWATGGRPRMVPVEGSDLRGVHVVRTRSDADAMMEALTATTNVVVVGGGYIGLEAAAALIKLGKTVTVLEAMSRVLARVAGEPLSRFYEAQHRAAGVDVQLEAAIDAFVGDGGKVIGVRLANGAILPADMVVVGIGIIPAVEPLLAAGAAGGNGVDVDEYCRTSLPDIYAIGDCAAHENDFCGGERIRLESVQNANDQALVVARAIAGEAQPYRAVPWFWSNQYDLRLQTVGVSTGHDDIVVRGDMAGRSFSIVYLKRGRVVALDCVNATRDYVQGRKLVLEGIAPDRNKLGDASAPLKELTG